LEFEIVRLKVGMKRIALVTGATAGIGKYSAKSLAKQGFKVSVVGRNEVAGNEGISY
jgi:short-subunit dehydrogenase